MSGVDRERRVGGDECLETHTPIQALPLSSVDCLFEAWPNPQEQISRRRGNPGLSRPLVLANLSGRWFARADWLSAEDRHATAASGAPEAASCAPAIEVDKSSLDGVRVRAPSHPTTRTAVHARRYARPVIVPRLVVAAAAGEQLLGLLAELPFDDQLRQALRWQHEHLNDIESGGSWTIDDETAVLHALVRSGQGEEIRFDVPFDLVEHREPLKAAGHTGAVLLIEDAHGGRPTREHLVQNALEITNIPADALAFALAARPRGQA